MNKILLILFSITFLIVSGCIEQNTQTIGDNSTVIKSTNDPILTLQPGEKLYYIDDSYDFIKYTRDYIPNKIVEFSNTHNVTRIQSAYDSNGRKIGTYIIYR